jgi:predicted ATPase with chaperone activity
MRQDVEARATAAPAAPQNRFLAALMNEEFYHPELPVNLADAGLSESLVDSLICKYLLVKGSATGRAIANQLCLPFGIAEPRMQALRTRSLVAHSSAATLNDYVYVLTEKGNQQAQNWMDACAYMGAAPVPLMQYIPSVEAQSIRAESVQREQLERSFAGISVNPIIFDKLGPAVNSGAGLFLYGEPGNGKTTLAERIALCFGQSIWLPFALISDGQIIKLFDPACHRPVEHNENGARKGNEYDRRWARIRRPTVIAGGELTMELLEIRHQASKNFSEAPLQLKSNCGVFLIDDFGRQRIDPTELLNRWIVPLEKGYDFLTLPTGQTIQVPFDQMIIFSTNLNPKDLVDEAFLRRLAYKIHVDDPDLSEFRQLCKVSAQSMEIEYDESAIDHLIEKHYVQAKRRFRRCHPRDLLRHLRSYCAYFGLPTKMKADYLDIAVDTYFTQVD